MSSRHASLALINTFPPPLFLCSISSSHQCVLHAVLGWILHLAEQQVFAGRNSDTWMRTVRLLIRDSASPLSPHLGRRGDAHRHALTATLTQAQAPSLKYEFTAGGHLSAGQIRAGKVKSSPAQSVQTQTEKCRSVCRSEKFTIVSLQSLELFLSMLRHRSTRVTNRRIKTNLRVTVVSVTVASGVPPTL